MKRSFLALLLAAMTSSSFAYIAQIDAGYTYTNHDDDYTDSDHRLNLLGTFYFEPVPSSKGPLNEGAFLNHASNVYGAYDYTQLKSDRYSIQDQMGFMGTQKDEFQNHNFVVGLEYFYEQFYFNADIGMNHEKYQEKEQFSYGSDYNKDEYDRTNYRALVGYMPMSNLLLAVGVDGYNGDDEDDEDNAVALKAKYVFPVGNADQYINLEADGAFGDEDNITVGGDYYFNKAFSLGAAYNFEDNGDDDVDYFSIRSKYFLNDMFAVGGAIGFGDDVQAFNVNGTLRF